MMMGKKVVIRSGREASTGFEVQLDKFGSKTVKKE